MGLITDHSETAQWYSMVNEAQAAAGVQLDPEVESYVVFMLMRFRSRPDMASRILAVDYLRGLLSTGRVRNQRLRDVGDHCLILAGLFPRRAQRLNVDAEYFSHIGQGAYQTLGSLGLDSLAEVYRGLGDQFHHLVGLLKLMRGSGRRARLTRFAATAVPANALRH